ncbi:MAG: DNA translocase FtsK 4TM domain-containing protein [Candidatus Zophobacter franzmannii]|nr:DNA translocase FtsK 4TM domain-containing protein [Candidatus Zophobacter franzmannii]
MTKQKKKKTTKKKGKKQRVISSTEKVVISLVVFMISLLVLISLLTKPQTLNSDHQIVNKTGILGNKVQTNVVESTKPQNPVGRLGAVTGYGLSSILGQKYSIILCLSVMFLLLVGILKKNKLRDAVLLILKINIFALLFQTLLNVNSTNLSPSSGLISHNIIGILTQLLQKVGTIIVLVSINLLLLAWVIGFEFIGGLFPKGSSSIPKKTIKPKKKRSIDLSTADVESFEDDNIEDDWREKPEININTHDDYPLPKARKTTPKKQVIDDTHNEDNFEIEEYVLPDIDELLTSPPRSSKKTKTASAEEIKRISSILQDKLAEFDIEADVLNVNVGPIITQYELKPAPGVKVNKFTALTDDLALALKAKSLRIQAPIPGRGLIGIELPNPERDIIYLKDLLLSDEMMTNKFLLPIALGKDISGRPVVGDLSKMPHLLVAGATGSGKSVCINTIITSLIVRKRPDELRMILIDPKRVELAPYAAIPHLIGEVVTDPDNALQNLQWAEVEMERRYGCLQDLKVRDIASYNDKVAKLKQRQ